VIILLHPDAGLPERSSVLAALAALDVFVEEVRLANRTGLVVTGGDRTLPADALARIPGVDRVVPLDSRTTLVESTRLHGPHSVSLGNARFGDGSFAVVAGPCTVESADDLLTVARRVRAAGATALRGGVFKTRTSPHAFQGGGRDALERLADAAAEVGLPFFTELTDPRQVAQVGDRIDAVQIGARNMQNFPLLAEVASLGKPVLLKRHMAADVDEWLLAAEYLLRGGNDQVVLCERGVRTPDRHVRFMLDLGVVPYLRQRVGLPVVVDPSHAAGDWRLVPALARAAAAAGADGLLIEVHGRPESTRCDAWQALPPDDFDRLMVEVGAIVGMLGRSLCTPGPAVSSARNSPPSNEAMSA
jgi:3-deoxy-7-phosphoheptulonate synthase